MTNVPLVMFAGWAHDGSEFSKLANHFRDREVHIHTAISVVEEHLPATDGVDVVGWSLGGMIALQLASQFPERIRRLVVFSSAPSFVERPDYSIGMPAANVRALSTKLDHQREEALVDFFTLCGVQGRPELTRRLELAKSFSRDKLQGGLRYLRETDLRENIAQIAAPTLLVHGREDRVISSEASEYLADRIPRAELLFLARANHLVPETLSPAELEHVISFLQS